MKKEAVTRERAPMGLPFSPAIRLGDLLFISGQGPFDKNGKIAQGDIKTQTRVTIENLRRIVEASGSSLDNVVQTTVYLKDLKDYAGMNGVYTTFFNDPKPARATVQAELLFGMLVEIQGIAHVPR